MSLFLLNFKFYFIKRLHNFGADFGKCLAVIVEFVRWQKVWKATFRQYLSKSLNVDLDHTADVQLHAWGADIKEAFEQVAMAMFGYMTTNYDSIDMTRSLEVEASGNDMKSLLFQFLDEWLFAFSADEFFFPRVIKITEFNRENFHIKSVGWGEPFDLKKHPQGTEVKAITYSNMQIHDAEGHHEVFVIIDI
ncbi:Protein archease [Echinococcus multilocularis]|uniref:Protein archease n=1 Tax=Echinococcus multilocularis TaxID=6211 RepID=A0A087W0C6_ECHMU|nr:Protein archease [Echinococcus multilocularis]